MTQDERRQYLIEYLLKEEIRFRGQKIPKDKKGQENLLRSLMNVRLPKPISEEFIRIQDEYLMERNKERGVTDVADLMPVASDSRLYIWQGDITTLRCDAIVNACNSQMLGCFSPMHACIDNFIHTYAGVELRLEMNEIMTKQGHEEETGKAKITSGYNLSAKYILHTVGPIIQWGVTKEDEELLASCYRECLKLAADTGVESVAFCCLSTGVFRFPQLRAAEIAIATVKTFLDNDDRIKKVVFNVFKDEDLKIYRNILERKS
ncbi:protein-ADP-ribose hydrolase [Muricomes intestini]|uniref:protein-ADP-ribose hydrolase n=1 Tax=Muricomes intestini TaxID=1796634 RepID=UPI002FE21B27